ncbi:hypothetical protein RP20_CCG019498, partial [Aedes albopictus]
TSNSPTLELDQQWTIKHKQTVVRRPRYLSRINPSKDCPICLEELRNNYQLRRHLRTDHGRDFSLVPVLDYDQRNHPIDRPVFKVNVQQLPSTATTFSINIENKASVTMALNSAYIFDGNYQLFPIFTGNQDDKLRMVPGYEFEEEVTFDDLMLAKGRIYSLIISATPIIPDEDFDWFIVEQYHFKEKDDEDEKVKPKKLVYADSRYFIGDSTIIRIFSSRTQLKLEKLYPYELSRSVQALYRTNFKENRKYTEQDRDLLRLIERSKQDKLLTPDSYREQLELLNQFEVKHLLEQFGDYTLTKPSIKRRDGSRCYYISTKQFKKKPSLLCEDGNVLFIAQEGYLTSKVFGTIEEITPKSVTCHMQGLINMSCVTKVIFLLNKTTFQLERNAVALMSTPLIESICFPEVITGGPLEPISSFQWIRQSVASNEEQMVAIRNIVNQTSFPAPYILFGPPGTGKTSTLVEAIAQIYHRRPNVNILVTATSNFAANELTSRLLEVIPDEQIFRFFSYAFFKKAHYIDWNVLDVSNLAGQSYSNLCYEDIYTCRVVVATLTTAGRLIQANIKSKHFSYVFIDECGSAKEISSLIPIAGLATHGDEINASVVLAGDPKQLGPVFEYEFLKQTTHSVSMLERLMNLPLYAKDHVTNEYNPNVLTLLRDNFRSHDTLINFSNDVFYEGKLRAKASPDKKNLAVDWWRLPNRQVPLIFHPTSGTMQEDKMSYSLFNESEALQVVRYVSDLLKNGLNEKPVKQSDIGILTFYARQVSFIKHMCLQRKWYDVEIGSAEQYQGREKAIIVISTVRSIYNRVGFLSNPKRLNVALTRACSLLIVIGCEYTLEKDPLWETFIRYCRRNCAVAYSFPTPEPKNGEDIDEDCGSSSD